MKLELDKKKGTMKQNPLNRKETTTEPIRRFWRETDSSDDMGQPPIYDGAGNRRNKPE